MKEKIYILVFSILLVLPMFFSVVIPRKDSANIENRESIQKPIFSADTMKDVSLWKKTKSRIDELRPYFFVYNAYYVDNFIFRDPMIRFYSRLKRIFGASPISQSVLIGKDDWYFLGEFHSNNVSENIGANPLTEEELSLISQRVHDCKSFCDSLNISFFITVAPDKLSIYSDKFPVDLHRQESRYDQVEKLLLAENVNYVGLKQVLLAKRDSVDLYFHLDSHWNYAGSYIAYRTLMDSIHKVMTETYILPDSMIQKWYYENEGDLSKMLALGKKESVEFYYPKVQYKELEPYVTLKDVYRYTCYRSRFQSDTGKGKLILFGDSFGCSLSTYFNSSFENTLFLQSVGGIIFDKELILKERPDCVLVEICERVIERLMNLGEDPRT